MARFKTAAILGAVSVALVGGMGAASSAVAVEGQPEITVADLDEMSAAAGKVFEGTAPWMPDAETLGRADALRAEGQESLAEAPEDCVTQTGDEVLPVLRFAGPNRYETATCVSFWTWPDHDDPEASAESKAQVVVLARGDNFPDALAGGPLAAYYEGPLLLTIPDSLPSAVMDEVQRVLAPGGLIYLLGGTSSISADIESQLGNEGFTTKRLAGSNRYRTAIAIAEELPDTSNFFFATGTNFPDALAAGNAAATWSLIGKYSEPQFEPFVILLTQGDKLGDATADFAWQRIEQFDFFASLITAGGAADRAAVDEFGAENLTRFVGSNRFDTAAQISEFFFTSETGELFGFGAGLATGLKFPDALAATALLARFGEPLLLTLSDHPSNETVDFLEDHQGEHEMSSMDVFGGKTTVSDDVVDIAWQAYK